jgi:hypothetical protein
MAQGGEAPARYYWLHGGDESNRSHRACLLRRPGVPIKHRIPAPAPGGWEKGVGKGRRRVLGSPSWPFDWRGKREPGSAGRLTSRAKRLEGGKKGGGCWAHQVGPLRRPGCRIRVHAKSMVHDAAGGCVNSRLGSHPAAGCAPPPNRRPGDRRDRIGLAPRADSPAAAATSAAAAGLFPPPVDGPGATRPALLPASRYGVKSPQLGVNVRLKPVTRQHQIHLRQKPRREALFRIC